VDGRHIATGSYNGRVAIYDRELGDWWRIVRPTTAGVSSLNFDRASGEFLASSYDGNIYSIAPDHT
jgi:WD40 repeat protein